MRPIASVAALDLDKFAQEFPAAPVEEIGYGFPLRFEAEPALALLISRNPKVGNPFPAVLRQPGRESGPEPLPPSGVTPQSDAT